jgi:hypothetical protein
MMEKSAYSFQISAVALDEVELLYTGIVVRDTG